MASAFGTTPVQRRLPVSVASLLPSGLALCCCRARSGADPGNDGAGSVASALTATSTPPNPLMAAVGRKPLFGAVIGGPDDYDLASDPLRKMTVDQALKHFRESG